MRLSAALVVSVRGVFTWSRGGGRRLLLDAVVSWLSTKSGGTYTLKLCQNTVINI